MGKTSPRRGNTSRTATVAQVQQKAKEAAQKIQGAAKAQTRSNTAAAAAAAAKTAAAAAAATSAASASSGPSYSGSYSGSLQPSSSGPSLKPVSQDGLTGTAAGERPQMRTNQLFQQDEEGSSAPPEQRLARLREALLGHPGLPASVTGIMQELCDCVQSMAHRLQLAGITDDATAKQAGQLLEAVADTHIANVPALAAQTTAQQQELQQVRDQLQSVTSQLGSMQQRAAKEQERHTVAVHVPSGVTIDEVTAAVSRAGMVQVKGASFVHHARSSDAPAAAAGQEQAAAGSSAGAGSSGGNRGSGRRFSVLVLQLNSKQDVRAVLSGRTRMALKAAGVPYYVDDDLTYAERQQRKQLQPLRRQLRAAGKRTRWAKAQLQQRVQGEQGRWAWQAVEYPGAPADSEPEEGEVSAGGQQAAAGGDAVAAGEAAT